MAMIQNKNELIDKLADEIADEVVGEISRERIVTKPDSDQKGELINAIRRLTRRIEDLEDRIDRQNKIPAIPAEKIKYADNFDKGYDENDRRLSELQNQIEMLRTGLIRLNNEVRRIRESLASEDLMK